MPLMPQPRSITWTIHISALDFRLRATSVFVLVPATVFLVLVVEQPTDLLSHHFPSLSVVYRISGHLSASCS